MIDCSKINCVGCTACESICPKSVISMKRREDGFLYPSIECPDNCIKCGLCEKVCPVLLNKEEKPFIQTGFIAQNKNNDIRKESASGGLFSAIAKTVIDNGGIVYGAAYSNEFEVKHIYVDNINDLWRLRNSKYVQSNICGVFKDVKKHLQSKRFVCFSGTPCQIEGLKCYLGKDYSNLLLVDVVCHGVSSPLLWEKYLETVKKYKPSNIYFRWKHYGYKYSTMSLFDENNNEIYFSGVESDKMLRAYFTNNCDRESCYSCPFKKRYRESDITMWDCFQPRVFDKTFDDDKGTSSGIIHTEKGKELMDSVFEKGELRYKIVDPNELVSGNKEMVGSVKSGDIRDSLLHDANIMSGEELFAKYFPTSFTVKIKKTVRVLMVKVGLYSLIKYIVFRYRKRRFNRAYQ